MVKPPAAEGMSLAALAVVTLAFAAGVAVGVLIAVNC